MTFTYTGTDLSTDLAKVRRLINDVDSTNPIFTDEEVNGFLTIEAAAGVNSPKRGAALALQTMAANELYVQKVMKLMDITTNGAVVATAMRTLAADLRQQSYDEEAGAQFDWAEQVIDDFTARERILDQVLRRAL
jgi:hypothetical protein